MPIGSEGLGEVGSEGCGLSATGEATGEAMTAGGVSSD